MDNEITVPCSLAFHLDRWVLSAKKFRWLVIRRRENDLDPVEKSASDCKRSKNE